MYKRQGYDAAMAQYNASKEAGGSSNPFATPTFDPETGMWSNASAGSGSAITAPNREAFYSTVGGGDGRPTLTQTLSPSEQALYNQEARTKGLLGGLGEQGAKSLYGVVGRTLDFSGMPARQPRQAHGKTLTMQSCLGSMRRRVDRRTGRTRR